MPFISLGAGNQNRTGMGCPIRPSNVRVYHFRHSRGNVYYKQVSKLPQCFFDDSSAFFSSREESVFLFLLLSWPKKATTAFQGYVFRIILNLSILKRQFFLVAIGAETNFMSVVVEGVAARKKFKSGVFIDVWKKDFRLPIFIYFR